MDRAAVEQLLDEMLSSLEDLETKAGATLQFLKDKGHATDKDLAPYLEQAGNASNVRWRAARLRMMSLLTSAMKSDEPAKEAQAPANSAKTADVDQRTEAENTTVTEKDIQPQQPTDPQPTEQTNESANKQSSAKSTKESEGRSPHQASVPDEPKPAADLKTTASEPNPSTPEDADETAMQASQDLPRRSKEDAA